MALVNINSKEVKNECRNYKIELDPFLSFL
jgi:hypothetical protein